MTKGNDKSGTGLDESKTSYTRLMKVGRTHYMYRLKDDNTGGAGRPIPWIQLKGHWLHNAGLGIKD